MRKNHAGRVYIWLPILAILLSGVGAGLHFTGMARKIPWVKQFYAKRGAGKKTAGKSTASSTVRPVAASPQKGAAVATIKDAALRTPAAPPTTMLASAPFAAQMTTTGTTPKPPSPKEQRLVRVARLFEAMQPEEAAAIMDKMRDPEIERVLSKMRERQAARLLAALKPERAASIAKTMASEVKSQ